ncbi:MAG TPA: pantetheine-phosphate adenylyltransferase [Polyangiaceae bacterium]|nr:pantetheine-phosphate adenylyltransferase [Polyangiaceae bacterium]
MQPHIAVYAGTFDPVTRGHLSVIERASRLFERLWVVVAIHPHKTPWFTADERVELLREVCARFRNVSCAHARGYVVDFARAHGARYLVRGVRSTPDVEGELALASANRRLAPEIETVFVPAHPELSEVSSSRLKQFAEQGQDISEYCPPLVARRVFDICNLRQHDASGAWLDGSAPPLAAAPVAARAAVRESIALPENTERNRHV